MRKAIRRQGRSQRQAELIDATIVSLARHGSGKVSVRLIASEADASPGLITHHFGSIDHLIAEAATVLAARLSAALGDAVERAGKDPRARLMTFTRHCFEAPVLSSTNAAAWLAVTGLSRSMPLVDAAQRAAMDAMRDHIRELMAACAPDRDHRLPAAALTAMIEGLWTEVARDTGGVDMREAQQLAMHWLRSLAMFDTGRSDPSATAIRPLGFAWGPMPDARLPH